MLCLLLAVPAWAQTFSFKSKLTNVGEAYGVAVSPDGNKIYVADFSNHKLKIFDVNGALLKEIGTGTEGNGTDPLQFKNPRSVAVDRYGNIYIADGGNFRVVVLNSDGSLKRIIGNTTVLPHVNLSQVAVGPDGKVYVADRDKNRVQVFDAYGTYLNQIGQTTAGSGIGVSLQFNVPTGVAVGADGKIFVADSKNYRIVVLHPDGSYLTHFGGTQGNSTTQLNEMAGLAVDAAGRVYVTDRFNERILVLKPNSTGTTFSYASHFGSAGEGDGQFRADYHLNGVAVDQSGKVYTVETGPMRVQIFNSREMQVKQGAAPVLSGEGYAFSSTPYGTSRAVTFTIENKGEQTLTLTGSPRVSISGTHAADFAVTQQPISSTLTSGGSTSFTVTFTPGAAGTRTAQLSIASDDAGQSPYTINLSGSTNPAATVSGFFSMVKTYGEAPVELGATANSTGAISYSVVPGGTGAVSLMKNSTTNKWYATLSKPGEVTLRASVASDASYAAANQDVVLTINKATPTITSFDNLSKTYGDAAFDLTASTSSTGGLSYSVAVGADKVTLSGIDNRRVAITKAGTVTLRANVTGDDNYNNHQKDITLTIAKAAATVTLPPAGLAHTYDGNAKTATVTTTPTGLTVEITYNGSSTPPTAAGTYAVVATINDANYSGTASGTLTITKQAPTITFNNLSVTYGEPPANAPINLTSSSNGGGTPTYSIVSQTPNDGSATGMISLVGAGLTINRAGTARLLVSYPETEFYAAGTKEMTLTVNRKTLTASLTGTVSRMYNGNAIAELTAANYNLSGVMAADAGAVSLNTFTTGIYDDKKVGTGKLVTVNTLTLTGTAANNYILATNTVSAPIGEVTKAPLTIVLQGIGGSSITKTYDGTNVAQLLSGNYRLEGVRGTDLVTYTQPSTGIYSQTAAGTGIRVSVQNLAITGGADADNYFLNNTFQTGAGQIASHGNLGQITAKPLTITLQGAAGKTYDGLTTATLTPANYKLEGLIGSETVTFNSPTAATFDNKNVGTGKTVIVTGLAISGAGSSNYSIPSSISGPIGTITARPLTITANDQSKVYGQDHSLGTTAFTANGLQNGETIGSVTLSSPGAAAAATVGGAPYPIIPAAATGGTFAASNYAITYANGNLTVTPALLTITANNQSKTYGDAVTFSGTAFSASGLVNGDAVNSVTLTSSGAAARAAVSASPYTITPSAAQGTGLSNYTITYANGSLTIAPKPASVTVNAADKAYNTADPAFTGVLAGFLPDDNLTATYSRTTGETVAGSPYTISATLAPAQVLSNYTITYTPASFTIDKATATIDLADATFTYDGTPKAATVMTNPAGLTVALTYQQGSEAVVSPTDAGTYTVAATVNDPNYTGTKSGTLTIHKAAQAITFEAPAGKIYGDTPFTLTATGGASGNPVNLSIVSGPATLAGNVLTLTGAGTVGVRAGQAGNANYTDAPAVEQSFAVAKKLLTVKAENKTKAYGQNNPALTLTYEGFVAGEDASVLATAPRLTTVADENSAVGSYPITVAAGEDENYDFAYEAATLTITKAPATIALDQLHHTYDGTAKAARATPSEEGLAVVLTYAGSATAPINAGTYPVVATINDANYEGRLTADLTIEKASLTITAQNASKTYDRVPYAGGNGVTYSGFVNGETEAVLGGTLSYGGDAQGKVNVGTYPITPGGLTSANYQLTFQNGNLTIAPKAASVTVNAATKVYGTSDPVFSGVLTGFLPADNVTAAYSRTAGETVAGSPYTISATLAPAQVLGNYSITNIPAAFTIEKATATVTLANLAHTFNGTAKAAVVSTIPVGLPVSVTYDGSATAPTLAGTYAVKATVNHPNYTGVATGDFLISKATQTITFKDLAEMTYGQPAPVLEATASSGLPVTFVVTGPANWGGSELSITGPGVVTVRAQQAGDVNYEAAAEVEKSFIVKPKPAPTLLFAELTKTYGNEAFDLNAGTNSTGKITYSIVEGEAVSLSGERKERVTILKAGEVKLRATVAETTTYAAAHKDITLKVEKAALTVKAEDKTRAYGLENPLFTLTYEGFVNGENKSVLRTQPKAATIAHKGSGVGEYFISVADGEDNNYSFTYNSGKLTITRAVAEVALMELNHPYTGTGKAVTVTTKPEGLAVDLGYKQGETTIANPVNVGNYQVTATVNDPNYEGAATATLTISKGIQKIALTAPADMVYGDPAPVLLAKASSGLPVSLEVTGPASWDGANLSITGAGQVHIRATQTGNANYAGAPPVEHTFEVAKRTLTVTAENKQKNYGEANPALTVRYSGFAAGEDASVLYGTIRLLTPAHTASAAGTYPIVVGGVLAENYDLKFVNGTLTIHKLPLMITAQNAGKTYDGVAYAGGNGVTYEGFVNGENESVLGGSLRFAGAAQGAINAGDYDIVPEGLTAANYAITYANGKLTISKATQTITFAQPEDRAFGGAPVALQATGGGSGNPVTFRVVSGPAAVAGKLLTITGTGEITVEAAQAGNANYLAAMPVVRTFTVTAGGKQAPALLFADLTKTYGEKAFDLTATSNSTGAITYSLVSGDAVTLDGASVAIRKAGEVTLRASQAEDATYTAASKDMKLTITPARLTITATAQDKAYDGNATALVSLTDNRVKGDVLTISYGSASFSDKQAGADKPVKVTGIAVSGEDAANYTFNTTAATTGSITVRELVISATGRDKTYNGTTTAVVSLTDNRIAGDELTIAYGSAAFQSKDAGADKAVSVTGITLTGADAGNYSFNTTASATATIARAPLKVKAQDQVKVYGRPNPELTLAYEGFVNGETLDVLDKKPTASTTATAESEAGTYPITVAGGEDQNYSFSYMNGTLQINTYRGEQHITFATLSGKTYGDAPIELKATAGSGLAVSFEVVSGPAVISGRKLTLTGAGRVRVRATQPGDENYEAAAEVIRSFTVAKKELIVRADNKHRLQGATANPVLTLSYEGFVNGDDESVLSQPPVAGTAVTASTPAGTYPISVSGGSDANYSFSYLAGTMTVSAAKASQQIAFPVPADKTYGDGPVQLKAKAGSGNAVAFELVSGPALLSNNTLILTGVGKVTVRATQAGDENYLAAPDVVQSFTVAKKELLVTADSKQRLYGQANPALTLTYSGFVDGEDASVLLVKPLAGTTAKENSKVGTYPIQVSGGQAANYSFRYQHGSLLISKAPQAITFDALENKTYDQGPVILKAKAGSGKAVRFEVVAGPATVAGHALTLTGIGQVKVRATQAGDENYEAAEAVEQSFTVEKAPAQITLDNLEQIEDGEPKPVRASTTPGDLEVKITYNGKEEAPTAAGTYTVTATVENAYYQGSVTGQLIVKTRAMAMKEGVVALYPNPSPNGRVVLEKRAETAKLLVEVLTLSGRLMRRLELVNEGKQELDFSWLPQGIYLLRLIDGEQIRTIRFQKL